ncbi:hypothetical protein KC19_9G145400 [Ceratodon purpureus]|uniref:Vacuolar protein sorting-associated protein 35 n=1 Tax=Ceratodon purpureus TaxID=3225 RepID=A0A8T0GVS4_CERPU|nr:hypothetical protein KC19_9G145400 [Ceratodon purpureus]
MEVGGVESTAEDQEKWLADAIALVQHNAFYMHRALDGNNLRDALKYSAQMLSELRTSKLSPQKYYELYMRLFGELQRLEIFFQDETKRGRTPADLYELVQHAGNILPRLYLLCTVGSVYIMSNEAPAKDVLKDLVEMIRGVQHPIRGLFLRNYLTQISRDKLPDAGSPFEGEGGSVMDAVEFVLQNFTEMNKLWVRMQHQGPAREKEKREKERSELRDLVGKNLHVLSQLEGVDLEMYKDVVLPRVLEQIVNCKDEIAQFYLMDCVIQVFPDDFHLQTLEILLSACPQLQPSVDVKTVMSQLMERLSKYAAASPEVLPDFHQVEAFSKFSQAVIQVVEAQPDMPLVSAISLYVALLTFVLNVHSDQLEYVDQVLGLCVKRLEGKGRVKDAKATKQLVLLLSGPLEKYKDVVVLLKLSNYAHVMKHLDDDNNRSMAVVLIQSVLSNYILITEPDEVDALLNLLRELVQDSGGAPSNAPPKYNWQQAEDEDFKEEQNLMARLVHMFRNDELEVMFKILEIARKHLCQGGPRRMQYTLPPLVFSTLKYVHALHEKELEEGLNDRSGSPSMRKAFQFLNTIVEALAMIPAAELALRLYLQCAEAAGTCGLEPVAYEFFTQAFLLYEEEISDSKAQVTALHLIIGTLQRTRVFGVENRDTLTHKATGYSAKLLKKPDQCRAVVSCSHLFWVEGERGIRDGERVLLCLKRALRIANAVQQMSSATRGTSGPMTLFVEILNTYLYYFDRMLPQITSTVIQGLVELIVTETQTEGSVHEALVDTYLANTLRYIQFQTQKGDFTADRYSTIQLP